MKRLISMIIATVMIVLLCPALCAQTSDSGLYIKSPSAPLEVTNYALAVYSRLHKYDLKAIGLNGWRLEELSLSPGVRLRHAKTKDYIDGIWCFPIKSMGKFSAFLLITEYDENYGFQFMQDSLADNLNDVKRGEKYRLFVSGDEMYVGVPGNENTYIVDISEDIYGMPDSYDKEGAYKLLPTKACSIKVYDNLGTCWASAAATVVGYKTEKMSLESIQEIRDGIVSEKYKDKGTRAGTLSDSCKYIERFTDLPYSKLDVKLSFDDLAKLIDSGSPAIIAYTSADTEYGHAVVLSGYSRLSDNAEELSYQAYYIADPNHPNDEKIMVGYSGAYTPALLVYDKGSFVCPTFIWTATGIDTDALPSPQLPTGKRSTALPIILLSVAIAGLVILAVMFKPKKAGERYF